MKALLIYNELSGRRNIKKDLIIIESFFNDNQWELDFYNVDPKKDLILDCKKLANKYDTFLIAGGDGTVHSVTVGLMKVDILQRPKLFFLPYGTTNDSAKMLGMFNNIHKNLKLLKSRHIESVDVYQANDNYFVYAAAVGKFSKISYEINRQSLRWLGPLGYFLNTTRDLFTRYKMKVIISLPDKQIKKEAFLIIMASGTKVAGFKLNKFSPSLKLNDGILGVRIFTNNHSLSWFKMVWFYLFKGKHFKNDIHLDVSNIKIELEDGFVWNIDGERGPKGTLDVKVIPSAIKVYINPKVRNDLF